jgi:phosphoribosylamine--glycine ligase
VFTDGKSFQILPTSMYHKRALDGDTGLNTGGMGAISPNPLYTESIQEEALKKIIKPTIAALKAENREFKGCLYFGLMLTDDGVKVIEYNCRFGDPETQVVLPLLDMNFNDVIEGCYNSTLKNTQITIENSYCCCVVLACGGYPEKYRIGEMIHGLNNKGQLNMDNVYIYHAGTKYIGGKFYTSAGRVLGVTAKADTLQGAINLAYDAVKEITFKNMQYRTDIGTKAL